MTFAVKSCVGTIPVVSSSPVNHYLCSSLFLNSLTKQTSNIIHATGDVPSKFEKLTTMASELALSAMHNGKFQHATASLALEGQLMTPHRCMPESSVGCCPFPATAKPSFKSRPIGRSASSSIFNTRTPSGDSAFTDDISKMDSSFSGEFLGSQILEEQGPFPSPPGLFHSSQSENSTVNHEDADACSFASKSPSEDCAADEWAAALVALADENKESAPSSLSQQQRGRSTSELSAGSSGSSSSSSSLNALSKSPAGFWHIRPGSLSLETDSSEEDEPICWTPTVQSSCHAEPTDLFSGEDNNVGPHQFLSPCEISALNLEQLVVASPTMHASFASPALDETSLPSGTSDDELALSASPVADQEAPLPLLSSHSSFQPLKKKSMSRSISYSAFSSQNKGSGNLSRALLSQSTATSGLSLTKANDLFRTYFIKFVDLLVVREIERLLHNTGPSTQGLAF